MKTKEAVDLLRPFNPNIPIDARIYINERLKAVQLLQTKDLG